MVTPIFTRNERNLKWTKLINEKITGMFGKQESDDRK